MDNGHRIFESHFNIQYEAIPDMVKQMILDCANDSDLVLKDPPPFVYIKEFSKLGVTYVLNVFTKEFEDVHISDHIYSSVWYKLNEEGIYFTPTSTESRIEDTKTKRKDFMPKFDMEYIQTILKKSAIFSKFDDSELENIISKGRRMIVGHPRKIVKEGDYGDSLFLIEKGVFEVCKEVENGGKVKVVDLKEGDIFGEMSFLTGEKRSATVFAKELGVVVEFSKNNLLDIFKNRDDIWDQLVSLKARRESGLNKIDTKLGNREEMENYANKLKKLIHDFWK